MPGVTYSEVKRVDNDRVLSGLFTDRKAWDTQLLQEMFDNELIALLLFSKIFTVTVLFGGLQCKVLPLFFFFFGLIGRFLPPFGRWNLEESLGELKYFGGKSYRIDRSVQPYWFKEETSSCWSLLAMFVV